MGRDKELMRAKFVHFGTGEGGTIVSKRETTEGDYLIIEYYPDMTIWTLWKMFLPFKNKTRLTKPFPKHWFMQYEYEQGDVEDYNPAWAVVMPDNCPFTEKKVKELQQQIQEYKEKLMNAKADSSMATRKLRDQSNETKQKAMGKRDTPSVFGGFGEFPQRNYNDF